MSNSRVVERFINYVKTPSESGHEREFCLLIAAELERLGFTVDRDECGDKIDSDGFNVHAFLKGSSDAEPLMFCCHMDTVIPGVGINPVISDGYICSDGTTVLGGDDKAGIAAVMEGVERLVERDALGRSVEVLFTLREETGLQGSGAADYSLVKANQAIVFDCGGPIGTVITRSPEMINFEVTVLGKAAHAAYPQGSIHALKAAALAVANINVGLVDDISEVNVGNFLAPGKTNIVCPKATFGVEVRSYDRAHADELYRDILAKISDACAQFGASYETTQPRVTCGVSIAPDSALLKAVEAALSKKGHTMLPESTFGGCDASNLSAHGIAALNVSCGMDRVHSTEERIAIADLEATADFVESILAK